jgi:16S rRNA (guanine527-N7)-methyltransferase
VTARDPWDELAAEANRLFELVISPGDIPRLEKHVDLLVQWSARMNLVGPATKAELVKRHVLDSLAVAPMLDGGSTVADFGSGAGFPALPAAIVRPAVRFYLVESRRKRCSFLRHAARTLGLSNVIVSESRGEDWDPPVAIDVVTSRALAVGTLAPIATRVLAAAGRLLIMQKQVALDPAPMKGFSRTESHAYRLPGGEGHEIVIYRRS